MFSSKNLHILCANYRKINTKWSCIAWIRAESTESTVELNTKTYSNTILFPRTDFPARPTHSQREEIQKNAHFAQLYNWQREHLAGPEFVLHDGPPYANGELHMGHAVNKIIKDINNRSQLLRGNKVHYVPGWDCHGLPIELKALQRAKETSEGAPTDPLQIRWTARQFALETVEKQKAAFESWGIMADWTMQYYLTLCKDYVQNQLRNFYKMYEMGVVYRALKPVYWSPSSKTALAEAELVYDPQFRSQQMYVSFPFVDAPKAVKHLACGKTMSAIIWTTTPWTLMANRAICYASHFKYSVVTLNKNEEDLYIVASALVDELQKTFGVQINRIVEFEGRYFRGATYKHKLLDSIFPFLDGDHVTADKGTGLVHTAPAHGPEDFLVALKNDMTVECNVDESGCYTGLDIGLDGLPVLGEGQDIVIARLGDSIIHQADYVHSYPLDWRTNQPVILRASQQWFIDTASLKDRALDALDRVLILPPSSADQYRQGFRAQLEKRPYWCVSRQRAWGVPIPALYADGEAILDQRIVENLCGLMEVKGADVWWTCDVNDFLPDDVVHEYDLNRKHVSKGKDIMDIWLDSGLSWQTLGGHQAHLYSEGVDQLTGWFQTSLLTSLALRNEAPYASIFVHGFVVDDKKRKMSKSIGNVVDPYTIINGGKGQPAYGVDTLRWWVASHATQHSQIVISKQLLDDCQEEVRRIRNIIKYLLAVINDLESPDFYLKPELNYFDDFMVRESKEFLKLINNNYDNYRYNHVAQALLFFISNKVSGLYCHCVKDRLYCNPKGSVERLSAQLVVHTTLVSMFKALAPILPHLVEEAWQYHPLTEKPFFFNDSLPVLTEKNTDFSLMDTILDIKRDICVRAKNTNLKKLAAVIRLPSGMHERLYKLNLTDGLNDSVLCEILELSSVKLDVGNVDKWQIDLTKTTNDQCLRCRKYNAPNNSDKCPRCEKVVSSMLNG